jgi:hypothetical protein
MLYRAIASIVHSADTPIRTLLDEPEVLVFFEAAGDATRVATLERLLSAAWGLPRERVDAYNIVGEAEQLSHWATGDMSTGDARLFESGCGPDGITYHERDRTLMFVRPQTLRRLVLAQAYVDTLRFTVAAPAAVIRDFDLEAV